MSANPGPCERGLELRVVQADHPGSRLANRQALRGIWRARPSRRRFARAQGDDRLAPRDDLDFALQQE